ncbi:MAG: arylamine N-acetyltransferase [Deltaproteobacteria bacterium]|nr:arylamine N-acetyltransferase [Deltaproteobacteria bacterium]
MEGSRDGVKPDETITLFARTMTNKPFHKPLSKPWGIAARVFKFIFWILVILTPLLGVWLASSLASYLNGPRTLAFVAGALLFPVLPVLWEIMVARRRSKKGIVDTRYLTGFDRIILRTLVINAVFAGVLLMIHPASAFTALSARGDWLLDGNQSATANQIRKKIFWTADKLEWLYLATHQNPYEKLEEEQNDEAPQPVPAPPQTNVGDEELVPIAGLDADTDSTAYVEVHYSAHDSTRDSAHDSAHDSATDGTRDSAQQADGDINIGSDESTEESAPQPMRSAGDNGAGANIDSSTTATHTKNAPILWPFKDEMHPLVRTMPESEKQTIKQIATYLSGKEPNPFWLAKAIHDYVADRVHYDFASLDAGKYPPYAASIVNRTQSGVCAGYAKLFEAIAKSAGFKCKFIVGRVRKEDGNIDGDAHAWNAIEIDGRWHLVDVTWDSAHAQRNQKMTKYGTDYLFTPPAVFALDHFPDKSKWQLLETPLSRGDFIRQPMMTAAFHKQKMSLVSPRRSQVTVDNELIIQIDNPRQLYVMATFNIKGQQSDKKCDVRNQGARATLICDFPSPDTYQVTLFSNASEYGTYSSVGHIEAVRL